MTKIESAWEEFRELVVPDNAGQKEILISKTGFCAGFASALRGIVVSAEGIDNTEIREKLENQVAEIFHGLVEFAKDADREAAKLNKEPPEVTSEKF